MVSSSEGSEDRIEVLRRKIAALELLAGNPGTTAAESESAQSAANKMRLELAKLVREAASRPAPSSDSSPGVGAGRAPDAGAWEAEAPPREAPDRSDTTPTPTQRRRISVRSAPAWTWQIPSLGIVALGAASFWLLRSEQPAPVASDNNLGVATLGAPAPPGAQSERERERSAILARIQKSGGNAAVAEAMRACRIRELVKEFNATSGAVARPGEESVDVRRRCGAYLTVRGFDDGMCFPATTSNPHPVCPIPE